ncbi:MAG TPA: EscU/YscU/HrcU family type III secretion system export apparatus switch protein [Luteibacter sp.]|uniref:EscU/YscU/HrcU family type III secretion system export apparatus switch protein n=1 Tax=Luteibacter sp. TaxID=1886636 RepID=UPI002D1D3114|nr:EscU/YscU/HrcU family type III secretion system export apparatus switch protein [Luteibacter sp.]HVI55103.1 EscU/YscU/HrcU family type III secretion system export apparatus switch protein [Luteibacter sp.]
MADDQQDKTEQPTASRLRDAREKGQAAKSAELTGVITLIVFAVAFTSALGGLAVAFARAMRASLLIAGAGPALSGGLARWLAAAFAPAWSALLPSLFALVVTAIAANVMQTGFMFSTEPLKADFSRMSPVKGFKRVFSIRTVWDLFRLLLKIAILGVVLYALSHSLEGTLLASATRSPADMPALLEESFVRVLKWVLSMLALIAVLDLLFSRREFIQKLRMSRRDMKDEHKRQEGDPAIRSKRRRLARDLLKKARSIARVPSADVIVTNPTHVAVALRYRPATMLAPIVVSKGSGWMAARIRRMAANHGVPMMRSPELARALFRDCDVDDAIPADRYTETGLVYRWVMARPGHKVHAA